MSTPHPRAKEVFLDALGQPAAERLAFIASACGDDDVLRQDVESLLEFHDDRDTSAPTAPPAPQLFATGELFANRYRMVARLGRGGMGEVWHAEDLVLNCDVALKLIASRDPDSRERILNEVRLARQITHPAVCRVFDVGGAEGEVFFSMELVRGEDLASLARRVGRLPSDKVIDIARQLCEGLAAAHAHGVLHRDLKPANVLIDDEGRVRITDFGIALPRTDATIHRLTGTPGYMAPEQYVPGTPLSDRTDIYALGVLLYELLVARPPVDASNNRVVPPSTLVPNVNPQLEQLVLAALSIDPRDRPASAREFAERLPGASTSRPTRRPAAASSGLRWRRHALVVGAIAAAATIAIAAFVMSGRANTLTEKDTIVLADFENATGEPVFDGTLKVALAVALEQSPFLKVFPDDRRRDTLRLMQRSPEERVTREIAREIAQREHLKALLAGSIASLGRNYVIALEAVNAATGDVMARQQAEAQGKEQVLTALSTAASALRGKLGESLASLRRFDVALPRATTPSLDALHAYSLALDEGRAVPRLEAIPHLRRAIELDPDFAMAHAQLSAVYANTDQLASAPPYARKAFELKDKVSERERFVISWRYYRDAIQAWDRALELARSWTATYPREAFAYNSLGSALLRLGQFEQAVEPFQQAIAIDPRFVPAYSNLAASLLGLNRVADAKRVLNDAVEQRLQFGGVHRLTYLVASMEGDHAAMARELAASVGVRQTNAAFGWQAHALAFEGRVAAAHEQLRRGVQMAQQGSFAEIAGQLSTQDAEMHAIVGQCVEAGKEAAAGLELSRDNLTMERASRALALCGGAQASADLSRELAQRFPEAVVTMRVALPVTAAALALTRQDAAKAVATLDPVRPYDRAPSGEFWPRYLRGLAYLQLKNGAAAAAEFKSIISSRGEVPLSMFYPLAHLGLARAAALTGDTELARKSYDELLALWSAADAALPALSDARTERSRLQ